MFDIKYIPLFLTFTLNIPIIKESNSCISFCSNNVNETASLHFRHDTDREMFSGPNQMFDIDCCADGFTNIQWYYHTSSNTTWRSWPWFKPCEYCMPMPTPYRELCDMDQKLQFREISTSDAGSYQCNVSSSLTGEYIIREYKLVVALCNKLNSDIQFLEQPDYLQQPADLGSNLTLTCAAYFGCPGSDLARHANWSYIDTYGNTHMILPGEDPHYNVHFNQSYPDLTVGSILTIIGVVERDYQLKLHCNLSTSTKYKAWNLTLHPPEKVKLLPIQVIVSSVCTVGGVTIILISALVIYSCYKPLIVYRLRRFRGTLMTRSSDQDDHHDCCIIYSEDNSDFVEEEIKQLLERENYDIFTKQMVPEGKPETAEADGIEKSLCVILVLSQAKIQDSYRVSVLASVAIITHGSSIIVIDMDDGWEKSDHGADLLKNLPKIVKTIKWRGKHKMNNRQLKNFLCEIKINLPDPRTRPNGRRNDRNTQNSQRF